MAHGDKKWIRDYAGRWKRSRHRTAQDRYAELPFRNSKHNRRFGVFRINPPKPDCPQCRYIWKQFQDHFAAMTRWRQLRDRMYADWCEQFKTTSYWFRPNPLASDKTIWFWDWVKTHPMYEQEPQSWELHWRTLLCFKCERAELADSHRWHTAYPGNRSNRKYGRKQEIRKYRRRVQHLMRHERYDDITPKCKGYLD